MSNKAQEVLDLIKQAFGERDAAKVAEIEAMIANLRREWEEMDQKDPQKEPLKKKIDALETKLLAMKHNEDGEQEFESKPVKGDKGKVRADMQDMPAGTEVTCVDPDEGGKVVVSYKGGKQSYVDADDIQWESKVVEHIRHEGGKWNLYSKKTGKLLGSHDTKEQAIKQEVAIKYAQGK